MQLTPDYPRWSLAGESQKIKIPIRTKDTEITIKKGNWVNLLVEIFSSLIHFSGRAVLTLVWVYNNTFENKINNKESYKTTLILLWL